MATVKVADNSGKLVEVTLNLSDEQVNMIASFVAMNRKEYFEDHSLDWALDQMLTRGKAEIKRTIKTAQKRDADAAAGTLLKNMNLTPAQAEAMLKLMQAEAAKKAQADAKK